MLNFHLMNDTNLIKKVLKRKVMWNSFLTVNITSYDPRLAHNWCKWIGLDWSVVFYSMSTFPMLFHVELCHFDKQ